MNVGDARQCAECGHALGAEAAFCGKCGTRYAPPAGAPAPAETDRRRGSGRACPNCGGELRWDALFCPECGHNCSKV